MKRIKQVELVLDENDGCCWLENDVLYINLRWCDPQDVVNYISLCTIHEVVEHILALGHEIATLSEKIVLGDSTIWAKQ